MNNWSKLKLFYFNSILLVFSLFIGELISRTFFPEFIGDYFSENKTRSFNFYRGKLKDIELIRTPIPDWEINQDLSMFLIIGDSLTAGHGLSYEDIYWVKLKNINNLISRDKIEVVPIAGFGGDLNNFYKNKRNEDVIKISNEFPGKKKYILYQFNFADISPKEINKFDQTENMNFFTSLDTKLKNLSGRHLQKSTFVRILRHYAGIIKRKSYSNKSCLEKGWFSLQEFSYAYASMGLEEQSLESWQIFENNISLLKELSVKVGAELILFISPTIFDIDTNKVHRHHNTYGLDFSCATIDPRKKLNSITRTYDIKLIDPAIYLKDKFEAYLKEGNFVRFFYAADNVHITPIASSHLSNFLLKKIFFDK